MRLRRELPRTQRRDGPRRDEAAQQKVDLDRVACVRQVAAASRVTNSPPVASATRRPPVRPNTSASPWMTSTGQRTHAHRSANGMPLGSSIPRSVSTSVSGVVSSPQPTQSSICFVECGSVKHFEKKNSRKPR